MGMHGHFTAASELDIKRLIRKPETIVDFLYDEARNTLNVDKAWHVMHFLLSGHANKGVMPLGFICAGGTPIGELDFGPARAFSSAEVRAIDAALRPIDRAELESRWDMKKIQKAEIYAVHFDDSEDELEYMGHYFDELKHFIAKLAKKGSAMIVHVA